MQQQQSTSKDSTSSSTSGFELETLPLVSSSNMEDDDIVLIAAQDSGLDAWSLSRSSLALSTMLVAIFQDAHDRPIQQRFPQPKAALAWIIAYLRHYRGQVPKALLREPVKSPCMMHNCESKWDVQFVNRLFQCGMERIHLVFTAAAWFGIPTLLDLISCKIATLLFQSRSSEETRAWLSGKQAFPLYPCNVKDSLLSFSFPASTLVFSTKQSPFFTSPLSSVSSGTHVDLSDMDTC